MEAERNMLDRDAQARIARVRWYHEFDFPGGLKARSTAPDVVGHRRLWRFLEAQLARFDFRGKTVLDVGCFDGYWSFYAERRGARSVLASDDVTQNWSDGQGLLLAKELLRSHVEVRQDLSVYDLASLRQTFDVILCFGLYYHLIDPFHAFAQIRHCCHPGSTLLLDGNLSRSKPHEKELRFRFGDPVAVTHFSAAALAGLLESAYFRVQSQDWLHSEWPDGGWRSLAVRTGHWLATKRQQPLSVRWIWDHVIDRAFTVCVPFEGTNACHPYEPPFGLARYDDRFRARASATLEPSSP